MAVSVWARMLHKAMDVAPFHQLLLAATMPRAGIESALRAIDADASSRMAELVVERKRLQNLVLELKGNIRVICRVRPFSAKEVVDGEQHGLAFPAAGEITLLAGPSGGGNEGGSSKGGSAARSFEFDFVADTECGQGRLYNEVQALGQSVLDGFNCCIFAYGQTGSGKTYTMTGTPADPGVNVRLMGEIFRLSQNAWTGCTYTFSVSMVELYNDNIRDLLNTAVDPMQKDLSKQKAGNYLDIKLSADGSVVAARLQEQVCADEAAAVGVMEAGLKNRSVGATAMNAASSRSHLIVTLKVNCHNLVSGVHYESKLHMVDLAGSERLSRTEATGDRLKEAQAINKSLSALGDTMSSLARKDKHVPYRNSKLTYFLQDSLGGDSKTIMVVNASPTATSLHETDCSLRFAQRVRKVELGNTKQKAKPSKDAMGTAQKAQYEKALQESEGRINALQEELRAVRTKLRNADGGGKARRPGPRR